jgi:predicted PurR-regulated permease PerM
MADGLEIATLVVVSVTLLLFLLIMFFLYRDRKKLVACIKQVNQLVS